MNTPTPEAIQAALGFLTQFFGPSGAEAANNPMAQMAAHLPGGAQAPGTPPGAFPGYIHGPVPAQAQAPPPTQAQAPSRPQPRPTLQTDLALTGTNLQLRIALPGLLSPDGITLRLLTPTELLVEAWLPPPPGLPLLAEIPTGMHSRLYQLPAAVRGPSLVTRYESGILTLTFALA